MLTLRARRLQAEKMNDGNLGKAEVMNSMEEV